MDKDTILATGHTDDKGAFIAFTSDRDLTIEHALTLLLEGKSNTEVANLINIPETTMLARISRNTDYVDYYAKAKVAKGILLIENLLSLVESIDQDDSTVNLDGLKVKIDVHKWIVGKYAPHFGKAMNDSGLTVNASNGSVIEIHTAPIVNQVNESEVFNLPVSE